MYFLYIRLSVCLPICPFVMCNGPRCLIQINLIWFDWSIRQYGLTLLKSIDTTQGAELSSNERRCSVMALKSRYFLYNYDGPMCPWSRDELRLGKDTSSLFLLAVCIYVNNRSIAYLPTVFRKVWCVPVLRENSTSGRRANCHRHRSASAPRRRTKTAAVRRWRCNTFTRSSRRPNSDQADENSCRPVCACRGSNQGTWRDARWASLCARPI